MFLPSTLDFGTFACLSSIRSFKLPDDLDEWSAWVNANPHLDTGRSWAGSMHQAPGHPHPVISFHNNSQLFADINIMIKCVHNAPILTRPAMQYNVKS